MQTIISQLQERYRSLDTSPNPYPRVVEKADVEQWMSSHNLTRAEVYDGIASELALGFHDGTLDFEFCDLVVNDLWGLGFTVWGNEPIPKLFNQVFLAFDSGEFVPRGEKGIDPIEKYTRPLIAEVVSKLT
jgi:hypothetical protein